jgi:hypothetical protein
MQLRPYGLSAPRLWESKIETRTDCSGHGLPQSVRVNWLRFSSSRGEVLWMLLCVRDD